MSFTLAAINWQQTIHDSAERQPAAIITVFFMEKNKVKVKTE